ncbi:MULTISPECIES: hypothetical protein [unclassified Solwaraspora]|uniref:hypothetical protein n=1 Tax=unclassified Solwaraspora TaxID=2627926 RepID=UPI00248B0D60|nr:MULTISPECIES: hypothetical protein [unclassified Solwaraspora]WBC20179.1 hypothetical protein O7543_25860 [Solwaraspora sp. WMMA2080]WJK32235.1 hypothetical protein O7610_15725 [Solwaraspora sp. WMMA2065]
MVLGLELPDGRHRRQSLARRSVELALLAAGTTTAGLFMAGAVAAVTLGGLPERWPPPAADLARPGPARRGTNRLWPGTSVDIGLTCSTR